MGDGGPVMVVVYSRLRGSTTSKSLMELLEVSCRRCRRRRRLLFGLRLGDHSESITAEFVREING